MKKELLDIIKNLSLKDKKTLSQKALKVSEETGELSKVVLPYDNAHGTQHRFINKTKILEEVCDVILSSVSIAYDLQFTDEEIEDMLYQKSLKWMEKQTKEEKVDFPLPYEIHITIKRPDDINDFIKSCEFFTKNKGYKLKPIILDLQNGGKSVMMDVMTSSKHMGNNKSASEEATLIVEYLKSDFDVVRTKIESVPWHPSAPTNDDIDFFMPEGCYFESHIGVLVNDDTIELLRKVSYDNDCHMSKNYFKKIDKNSYIIMLTHRSYDNTYENFVENVEKIKSNLIENNFAYDKVIIEFSVYDTKVSHDQNWLA